MKQSEIEEMIDESFNYLIDTIINFPENPYHINFEKIFFRGKANLIHKFEKIIEKKDKQIDLMADKLVEAHEWFYSEFDNFTKEDFIQYFERKVEDGK